MKLFLIIILTAFAALNYYVFLRLWQMLPTGSLLRPLLIVGAVIAVGSVVVAFAARHTIPVGIGSVVYSAGTSWMVILVYLLFVLVLAELLPFTGLVERSAFLKGNYSTFFAVIGIVALVMVAANINYHHKRRAEVTVDTPSGGDKAKMVVISDLHLGYTIGPRELSRWVDKINAEQPDVILIVGDLIDTDVRLLYRKRMDGILNRFESRYGVYLVPGNHEYLAGIDASLDFIRTAGITVLRDSLVTIADRFTIAGRDDRTNPRRKPLEQLVGEADRSIPLVVADHQPADLSEAVDAGALLQVSGHTHRGQVWPFNWVTDRIYEDSHGYIQKGPTGIYVSSGLGIWGGKFRIGTVSEYVVVYI